MGNKVAIAKMKEEQQIVTGVVYEPNKVDSQGDFMDAETIEKVAYEFMENYQNIDISHDFKGRPSLKVVESYIAKADTNIGGRNVKKGSWVLSVKVNDKKIWGQIKEGKLNGFSMGGTGVKETITKQDQEEMEMIAKAVAAAVAPLQDRINKLEAERIEKQEEDALRAEMKNMI